MGEVEEEDRGHLPPAEALALDVLVDYADQSIVSRGLMKAEGGNVTLFAFDGGQGLSEHTTPCDALVQVLEGEAHVTIGGSRVAVRGGESVLMPAQVPHALHAPGRFKMLLTMLKSKHESA